MLARLLLRRWHARRAHLVRSLQCLFRGWAFRRRLAVTLRREHAAALRVQRVWRGVAARRRLRLGRLHAAATMVQRVWRGARVRARTDRLWMAKHVRARATRLPLTRTRSPSHARTQATLLQRMMRGLLARRRVRALRSELAAAATEIQRRYRGMRVRVAWGDSCAHWLTAACASGPARAQPAAVGARHAPAAAAGEGGRQSPSPPSVTLALTAVPLRRAAGAVCRILLVCVRGQAPAPRSRVAAPGPAVRERACPSVTLTRR